MQQSLILLMYFLVPCALAIWAPGAPLPKVAAILSLFAIIKPGVEIKAIKIIMYLIAICLGLYYSYESEWLPIKILTPACFGVSIYMDYFRKKPAGDWPGKKT